MRILHVLMVGLLAACGANPVTKEKAKPDVSPNQETFTPGNVVHWSGDIVGATFTSKEGEVRRFSVWFIPDGIQTQPTARKIANAFPGWRLLSEERPKELIDVSWICEMSDRAKTRPHCSSGEVWLDGTPVQSTNMGQTYRMIDLPSTAIKTTWGDSGGWVVLIRPDE